MKKRSPVSNIRPAPDRILVDTANYVLDFKVENKQALDAARLCLIDSLACALDALDFQECTKLVGPEISGAIVPRGARVPGTRYELSPARAAFSLGCMTRWLDFNDTFNAVQVTHPSDNLAAVLSLADYLSRHRSETRDVPLKVRDVLEVLVKAYEIQGCLAMENNFEEAGIDYNLLTRVASTGVLTGMLGGTREQIVNALSNAWMDCSLIAYRHAPNTGWRKSWACADASAQAVRLAMMAVKDEMGYPSVLSAPYFGFQDARFGGNSLRLQTAYCDYVIRHSMFKFVPAGMHAQSAVECAFRLHPMVKDRLDDIERINVSTHQYLMNVMHKTGPLHNPADRDHCAQYVIAVGLIQGKLAPRDYEDGFAANPQIDRLREKMELTENPRYTEGFLDPGTRSSANAIQVFFRDGSKTAKVETEYPIGHQRRRTEFRTVLQAKFAASLARRFPPWQCEQILELCDDGCALERMSVDQFLDNLVGDLPV